MKKKKEEKNGLFGVNEAENPRCPFPRINRRSSAAVRAAASTGV